MNRKLKLALAALLGFSAACSTVKNAPVRGEDKPKQEADSVATPGDLPPRMVVMYGVRIPQKAVESNQKHNATDSLDPVLEQPVDDTPVVKPRVSPNSAVDPVVEKAADE